MKKRKRQFGNTVNFVVILFLLISFYSTASAQLAKLNVGYVGINSDNVIAWVAKETGIFAKNSKAEDFVDMRFIKELDESGYIDSLYKGKK